MDFFDCVDIFDFYKQSNMNRLETFIFLTNEIKKLNGSELNEKQQL